MGKANYNLILDLTWKIERPIKNLIIPIGNKNYGNELIIRRAKEVIDYYQNELE